MRSPLGLARARRRVAIMVAAALLYAVALLAVAIRSPDRGFFTFQGGKVLVVDPASHAAAAGLRVGDLITAIDGRPIDSAVARFRALQAIEPGETVALTVRRADEERTLSIEMPRRLPLASAAGIALALVMLGLALVADRGQHHSLPQQFLRSTVIYVVFLAGAFALDITVSTPLLAAPWLYAMCLAAPATCHFMLRFPAGPARVGRRALALLYGPPLAIATVLAVNHASFSLGYPLPGRRFMTGRIGWLAMSSAAVYLVAGAVARARRMRRLRGQLDPVAVRWLVASGLTMSVPLVLAMIAGARDVNRLMAGGFRPYVAVTMVGGSACVVMAMTRVRFGELDRLWRRSTGYVLATLLAAGLYLVAIALLGGAATVASGGSLETALAATLAAAIVFGPLRVRVQRMVDDRFARDRRRARKLLR
ncbi:MAG TPA: PDZ domain-containing protein, partial [Kofleriaceae bacterium]|nr:PDZ domain-containing protein [Kofleriaceae bacterium]